MLALFTLASALAVAAVFSKRSAGSIVAPTAASSINSGSVIPFNYVDLNWCHEGYTPITVYLSETQPTSLNATGGVTEYMASYGPYLIPNYGLAPLSGSQVPPQNLTMPDISAYTSGSALYLSVVETALAGTCPPGNQPAQYQFSTTSLTVA
ncbi:hypothetical protein MSAN_02108200 [Mycena sanguinolenta]|uniref:Uncharacterized protein n=1 Tax=Mycena sanguinolenta TaxID=230812 RepID=A0A8H6XHU1_9AGAR|nr:hypothetical protein MSAN_02108200 [Mycena sanguinolenta]